MINPKDKIRIRRVKPLFHRMEQPQVTKMKNKPSQQRVEGAPSPLKFVANNYPSPYVMKLPDLNLKKRDISTPNLSQGADVPIHEIRSKMELKQSKITEDIRKRASRLQRDGSSHSSNHQQFQGVRNKSEVDTSSVLGRNMPSKQLNKDLSDVDIDRITRSHLLKKKNKAEQISSQTNLR